MNPNERSARPGFAWNPPALVKAQGVLLALLAPPFQVDDHERGKRPRQAAIEKRKHHPPSTRPADLSVSGAIGDVDIPWPTRRSASPSISTMRVSTRLRARSSPASSSRPAISIGSPHRYTPRPNGNARWK